MKPINFNELEEITKDEKKFVENKYKSICEAVFKLPKSDYRNMLRRWIMLFEQTNVADWNRDEFLECLIEVKERNEKQNIKKQNVKKQRDERREK